MNVCCDQSILGPIVLLVLYCKYFYWLFSIDDNAFRNSSLVSFKAALDSINLGTMHLQTLDWIQSLNSGFAFSLLRDFRSIYKIGKINNSWLGKSTKMMIKDLKVWTEYDLKSERWSLKPKELQNQLYKNLVLHLQKAQNLLEQQTRKNNKNQIKVEARKNECKIDYVLR